MTRTNREVYHIFLQAVYVQIKGATLQRALGASCQQEMSLYQILLISFRVSCHFRLRSAVDHAMLCSSMKMEVPGLADSLQQCLCGNSGTYAGDVLDTDPGWQQSKLIWALSAEIGSASRMRCTGPMA